MMHLTMRYGFPTYVEDADADRHPKNETLAEHKLHCKAKPDNCPFEKRAAKKAEEEDEAGDPKPDEILTNSFYPDNSSVLPPKSIAGIKAALDIARPEIVKAVHEVFSSSKEKSNLKDFDLNGVRIGVRKDGDGNWEDAGEVVLSGILSKGSETYAKKIGDKIREKFTKECGGGGIGVIVAPFWHSDHGGWFNVDVSLSYPCVRRIAHNVKGETGSESEICAKNLLKEKGYELVAENVCPVKSYPELRIPLIAKDTKKDTLHFISIQKQEKPEPSSFTESHHDEEFLNVFDKNISNPEMGAQYLSHWSKIKKGTSSYLSMHRKAKNILFTECVKHWLKNSGYKGDYCADLVTVFGSPWKGKILQTMFTGGTVFSQT